MSNLGGTKSLSLKTSRFLNRNDVYFYLILLAILYIPDKQTLLRSVAMILVVAVYSSYRHLRVLDGKYILLGLFLFSYCFGIFVERGYFDVADLTFVFFPMAAYTLGKVVGLSLDDDYEFYFYNLMVAILVGFDAVCLIAISIYDDGFFTASRDIFNTNYELISATVLGGTLAAVIMMSGSILSSARNFSNKSKLILGTISLLWLTFAIRLGSRTLVVILLVSFILSFYVNRDAISKGGKLFLFLVAMLVFSFLYFSFDSNSQLFHYYADRINSDEHGIVALGGRTESWALSIIKILENPFGWKVEAFGYSHNLWIDSARVGGWMALSTLLLFTGIACRDILSAYRCNSGNLVKTVVLCTSFGYLQLFMVEPILDGFLGVFSGFCTFFGLVQSLTERNSS